MLCAPNQSVTQVEHYPDREKSGTTLPPIHFSFPTRYAVGYSDSLDHFADAVIGLSTLSVTKDDVVKLKNKNAKRATVGGRGRGFFIYDHDFNPLKIMRIKIIKIIYVCCTHH